MNEGLPITPNPKLVRKNLGVYVLFIGGLVLCAWLWSITRNSSGSGYQCLNLSYAQTQRIVGILDFNSLRLSTNSAAVRSRDHTHAYYVAGVTTGGQTILMYMSGDPSEPGLTMSLNASTQRITTVNIINPDIATEFDSGARAALACVR